MGYELPKRAFVRKSGSGSRLSFKEQLPGEGGEETPEGCLSCLFPHPALLRIEFPAGTFDGWTLSHMSASQQQRRLGNVVVAYYKATVSNNEVLAKDSIK